MEENRRRDLSVRERVERLPDWQEAMEDWRDDLENFTVDRLHKLRRELFGGVVLSVVLFAIVMAASFDKVQNSRVDNLRQSCSDANDLRRGLAQIVSAFGASEAVVRAVLPVVPDCGLYAERRLAGIDRSFTDEATFQCRALRPPDDALGECPPSPLAPP